MKAAIPHVRAMKLIGPCDVGSLAAGLVVACALSTAGALLSLSSGAALSLILDVAFVIIAAIAMRLVLRSKDVSVGRCMLAGAVGGAACAAAMVIVVAADGKSHQALGVVAIAVVLGAIVLGSFAGLALYPLATRIGQAIVSRALDATDRAFMTSAWWLFAAGAACALLEGRRANSSALVGFVALALAAIALGVVAVREARRRAFVARALESSSSTPPRSDIPKAGSTFSIVTRDPALDEAHVPPVLCTRGGADSMLVEHQPLEGSEGPVFRTAPRAPHPVALLSPVPAMVLMRRRLIIALVGAVASISVCALSIRMFREMAHYRYRGAVPLPTRVDGFVEDGAAPPVRLVAANGGVCAILADSTVSCFGNNANRFIGLPYVQRFDAGPLPLGGIEGTSIALGDRHACIIDRAANGVPRCWGSNRVGAIGDGTHEDRPVPVPVKGIDHVTDIALGDDVSFAVREDGTLWRWGHDPRIEQRSVEASVDHPIRVEGVEGVRAIAASASQACVAEELNGVSCWGFDDQPWEPSIPRPRTQIAFPSRLIKIKALRVSGLQAFALAVDGSVWSFGNRLEEPRGSSSSSSKAPRRIDRLQGALDIALGNGFACALMPDGNVPCCGNGQNGVLGDGLPPQGYRETHARIDNVIAIASGDLGVCAVKRDHTVWCWGWI